MVQAAGAKAVYVDTRPDGCILTPERLEAALTPRTRVVVMVSPGNPTGVTHTHEQLAAVGEVLRNRSEVFVLSDEIYQHLVYGETRFVPVAVACPWLLDRTITVRGVSKSYAMTGWRIGYAAGPREVIDAMIRYQSHATSNATAIAQVAALAALTGPMEPIERMRQAFDRRRQLMVRLLEGIPGFHTYPPTGAFYCFPDVTACLGERTGRTPLEFSERLLDRERVVTVPGEAFGADANIRLSYACSEAEIEDGIARIKRFVTSS
jgi:aspartate aminotransferase